VEVASRPPIASCAERCGRSPISAVRVCDLPLDSTHWKRRDCPVHRTSVLADETDLQLHAAIPASLSERQKAILRSKGTRRSISERTILSLYWKPVPSALLNEIEREAVKALNPLLNRRSSYSKEHTTKLDVAYKGLYLEVLARHLGED